MPLTAYSLPRPGVQGCIVYSCKKLLAQKRREGRNNSFLYTKISDLSIAGLAQDSPGYWQRACTESIPRNCLLDMVKVAGSDSSSGDLQRTVIKVSMKMLLHPQTSRCRRLTRMTAESWKTMLKVP